MRLLGMALLALLFCASSNSLQAQALSAMNHLQHGEMPLPGSGGPLNLVDTEGKAFKLQQLKGEPVMLFFGFTQCSQTCPIAIRQWQATTTAMGVRRAPRVVFVTLDPLSDSPRALKAYVAGFGPKAIGLTGSPSQIDEAARRYGIGTQKGGAELAHSARWILLDPDLQPSRTFKVSISPAALARDLVKAQQAFDTATLWQKGPT